MAELKERLLNILQQHQGRQNAITGRELARLLNQSDDRKVRLLIRELITEGVPVASVTEAPAGYFIARTFKEAEDYRQQVKSRTARIR
jgi:hypothetical protein